VFASIYQAHGRLRRRRRRRRLRRFLFIESTKHGEVFVPQDRNFTEGCHFFQKKIEKISLSTIEDPEN
jgi:hypothetical protein